MVLQVDDRITNNVVFITLTFAQLFHVFNMSSDGAPLFNNDITRNKFVWIDLFICAGLILMVFAIPGIRLVLGLSVIPIKLWVASIAISMLPLVAT
ncbi:cation transporting ATPase C-terminal domain-containing protein [Pedobacter sp. NJ-S-72]